MTLDQQLLTKLLKKKSTKSHHAAARIPYLLGSLTRAYTNAKATNAMNKETFLTVFKLDRARLAYKTSSGEIARFLTGDLAMPKSPDEWDLFWVDKRKLRQRLLLLMEFDHIPL